MNGSADLSEDQLHLLCEYFNLNRDETKYLELLLQFAKSGLKDRKDVLKREIHIFQSIKLDIKNNIDVDQITPEHQLFIDYFLNPQMQIVHVALNVKKYQTLESLEKVINSDKKALIEILDKLIQLNLIEYKNKRYQVIKESLHLPKDSHLIHPHQTLLRVKSLEHKEVKSRDSGNYTFSVTFSCDEDGRKKIQEDFIKYLKSVQKTVQNAGTEEVYQINFDLFSWTK